MYPLQLLGCSATVHTNCVCVLAREQQALRCRGPLLQVGTQGLVWHVGQHVSRLTITVRGKQNFKPICLSPYFARLLQCPKKVWLVGVGRRFALGVHLDTLMASACIAAFPCFPGGNNPKQATA